ncbi:NUDIX hydrolase [Bombilactobacillus folatiphilus]|uniref:NUDIX hydrolase n=1 Tax=Bombilactobacillus folatiphilus TaxID=2923362 RepID=A0ABY4PAH7_9LACO|nr:NUDIX hydrolase [Bombilactobacillus folatiphilus]UQS82714.1 NUDIX hydrolase [Bombilactobacillus folatiphilus]
MDLVEKKLTNKRIYTGKILNLDVETVQLPNKQTSTREIVHHHGAVGVIAFIDHKLLLVKQWREPMQCLTLEIPAGKVEPNCQDLQAEALRELNEETGYTGSSLQRVTGFYSTPGFSDEYITLFQVSDVMPVQHKLPLDEDEFVTTELLTLEQANEQVKSGLICDAKTIWTLLFWQQFEGKK